MLVTKAFAAVLTAAGLVFQNAIAHSVQRRSLSYVTRIDNTIIQTPSHRVHAHTSFDVTFQLHNKQQNVRLSLDPNTDLFSDDAAIQHVGADGTINKVEALDRRAIRVFRGESWVRGEGSTEWKHVGWARISLTRDGKNPIFTGVFTILGDHHHVKTASSYRALAVEGDPELVEDDDDYMVVWRDTDISAEPGHADLKRDLSSTATCGSDELLHNQDPSNLVYRAFSEPLTEGTSLNTRSLFGRQDQIGGNGAGVNLAGSIGSTAGCPTTRKVALIGVATDCGYTSKFRNKEEVRSNIIDVVNSASELYERTFNISLGIQNLTISDAECPATAPPSAPWNTACSDEITITERLSQFSEWRGQWPNDGNAYWTLLTSCGTGNAVGLAWLGAVCQAGATRQGNETTASANVVVRTSTEWLVFAHETGHTFGAVHDCMDQTCARGDATQSQCCPLSRQSCDARGNFIMNPSTGSGITQFSPCSVGNICSFLGRSSQRASCLTSNRGLITITGQQCGNGIVEAGEDCDCGGEQGCQGNPCCDPKTCKFTTGSQCDFSNEECCTGQCRFASQGSICRPSTGPCDPEEKCSGTTATCPSDESAPDGQSCGEAGAGLQCASGRCTSRDLQCKTMMGSFTSNNDTYSCSSSGCTLSCASPEFGANRCLTMRQYFLDGTPCEGGGKCSNGNCQGTQLGQQILDWINDNKPIFIPVVIVVGLLFLMAVCSCLFSCCRKSSRSRRKIPKPVPPPYPYGNGMPAMRGPPPQQQGSYHAPQQQGWEPMRSTPYRYA
ncbi:Metallo-peptidase family M12-domain-containing protein [Apiosordaria backusii]|uniref:Disintegrin and metalloproteinase domain-containing protein B n=1 Tax=Apiosordaria backusii TaxID=314023 RepID=A0AA40EY64_9PEZI|nr:Metallo-peptidase family M12-domain-containing protein [Apiosordaria backusii]